MKIRRSMVVLFIISTLLIPISLYRSMYSENASWEFLSTVGIINNVLIGLFLLLVFSFSIFTDEYPHSYQPRKSTGMGFVSMLLAAACGYTSVLGLISDDYLPYTGTSAKIFSVLGIASVLAFMFYSITFFKGENVVAGMSLAATCPALWYGYRMLLSFLKSASMADISSMQPVIAMCCSFAIFALTLGKLFSGMNSNSIKWGFATGCIGILTSLIYTVNWFVNDCESAANLLSNPLVFADLFMAFFAVGALFHVSVPAEYFDDGEWDDYFYETYDLPKPNLILHTPVDELEEDSLVDDDSYIPMNSSIGRGRVTDANQMPNRRYPQGTQAPLPAAQQQPAVPSYIANPAAYYPQYPPAPPAGYYPPQAYPAYPVYPYQGMIPSNTGYDYYPTPAAPTEYNPYDAAAAQYQYERRRAELQNRELEKLTGEVDNSLARLNHNVEQNRAPSNQYVAASPDEKIGGRFNPSPSGRSVRLAQGYTQTGERLTDHIDRLEQENRERNGDNYPSSEDDEYTYEYYYPTDGARYNLNQFRPGVDHRGSGNPGGGR